MNDRQKLLSWIETILQQKIIREKEWQKRTDNTDWELLLFENRKLILLEVQSEIKWLMNHRDEEI